MKCYIITKCYFRSYYKEQDQLITAFEDIQMDQMCDEDEEEQNIQIQRRASNLAKASFAVNLVRNNVYRRFVSVSVK